MTEEPSPEVIPTIKVLYNASPNYCEAAFSDEFKREWVARNSYATPLSPLRALRDCPIAIAIFEERGPAWSSGPYTVLAAKEIPTVFRQYWKIESPSLYGAEEVIVDTECAIAQCLANFMQLDKADPARNIQLLEKQYKRLLAAASALKKPATVTPGNGCSDSSDNSRSENSYFYGPYSGCS